MKDVETPQELDSLRTFRPYFNTGEVSVPTMKYVAWLDIMGADSIMRRSMPVTANFLCKLHISALEAQQRSHTGSDLNLYPIVDGLYITSSKQGPILSHIKETMTALAATFIFEEDPLYHFMPRACVAFGPVWEGEAFMTKSHTSLRKNKDYSCHILLGPCVTQAFYEESSAAPFGVWIHESARAFGPSGAHPLTHTHWHWWRYRPAVIDSQVAKTLAGHLIAYLGWCKSNSTYILYKKERIEVHLELVKQYFGQIT